MHFTGTSQLHLSGHQYAMYWAVFPGTKSPLCSDCLWVSFLMEKQAGLMSPMPLPSHPILCSIHKEDTLSFFILNQGLVGHLQVWACVISSALLPFFHPCQGPAQSLFLLGYLPLYDPGWNLLAPIPPLLTPSFPSCPNTLGTSLSQSFS